MILKGDKIELVVNIDPTLRKGEEGIVTKILSSGGYEIKFKGYPFGYGKTLGSKGEHVRLSSEVIRKVKRFWLW